MTADLSALLDRLEAAAAAATRPRWAVTDPDRPWLVFSPYRLGPVADCSTPADTDAIVAAVNALPTLVAELRAHQAAVQAVQRAIETAPVMFFGNGYPVKAVPVAQLLDLRAAVAALDPKE